MADQERGYNQKPEHDQKLSATSKFSFVKERVFQYNMYDIEGLKAKGQQGILTNEDTSF